MNDPISHHHPCILVADDDEAIRTLLRRSLERKGYEVTCVEDGQRALEEIGRRSFDLMVVDVWMPRMTGLELLAKLKNEANPTRAVVMTGDDTSATLMSALREQAFRCVHKPFVIDRLLEVVERALATTSTAPPIAVLSATPQWIELLVPCEREAAERIHDFLMQLETELSEEVRDAVGHAFQELLLNAVEWGGEFDPERQVRISVVRAKRVLVYRISDPGKGFKFEDLAHAAVGHPGQLPIEHVKIRQKLGLRPGGLGILMTRAIVDELVYNEVGNEVLFVKYP